MYMHIYGIVLEVLATPGLVLRMFSFSSFSSFFNTETRNTAILKIIYTFFLVNKPHICSNFATQDHRFELSFADKFPAQFLRGAVIYLSCWNKIKVLEAQHGSVNCSG